MSSGLLQPISEYFQDSYAADIYNISSCLSTTRNSVCIRYLESFPDQSFVHQYYCKNIKKTVFTKATWGFYCFITAFIYLFTQPLQKKKKERASSPSIINGRAFICHHRSGLYNVHTALAVWLISLFSWKVQCCPKLSPLSDCFMFSSRSLIKIAFCQF